MRLKKITLHGYKTFANPTEIRFDTNISAIVGPNGSGKSNIADGIRWVMGEQAYSVLRGKKTEDMIFNGSNQKSRMGMAEVSILLDNVDNWLPIDFDEVAITRRAYRSGENEYYINGSRVRLKDVHEMLDRSGLGRRTHTVIGQGMIDQALSQRPEDRRVLFEEAAGITHYRTKRRLTMDRLGKTKDNLTRVQDIIVEIEPRLRKLEKQAEKAIQHDQISGELRKLLRVWYGYTWHQGVSKLIDARAAAAHWQQIIQKTSTNIEAFSTKTADLRRQQTDLRGQLAAWRRELAELENNRSELHREKAVVEERIRALHTNLERLTAEIGLLQENIQSEKVRRQDAQTALEAIHRQHAEHRTHLQEAQNALQVLETDRLQTEQNLSEIRLKLLNLTTDINDRKSRIQHAKERREVLKLELAQNSAVVENASADVAKYQASREEINARLQALTQKINDLQEHHRLSEIRHQETLEHRTKLERQRAELAAQVRELQARYELLERLRAEGEGLYAGVKQVVRASHQGRLQGVRGPIANLLDVPSHLEQAIEVALGGRLQDVVVENWSDAESAIAFLKETQGGRATFLPLDNLRPQHRNNTPREKGVLGWAADLIDYDKELSQAVDLLLGQILVVNDLAVARRISRSSRQRLRIVTLEGDYVHPGGSVSGGSRNKRQKGGVLAREREYRQLPDQIKTLQSRVIRTDEQIENLRQAALSIGEELEINANNLDKLSTTEKSTTAELAQIQNKLDQARQAESWHKERMARLNTDMKDFGQQLTSLHKEIQALTEQQTLVENRKAALEEKLATLGTSGMVQAVAQAQARLDAIAERVQVQTGILADRERGLKKLHEDLAVRKQRIASINQESNALTQRLETIKEQLSGSNQHYQVLRGQILPAQERLDELENGWIEHDAHGEALRQRLHQEERQLNKAQLALQRAEDQLKYLRRQIENDFGLVTFETEEGVASQEPLPFDQIVTTLPKITEISPEMQQEIQKLKGLLRHLGPINPEAQAEYKATKERFEFLTQQSQDLEDAAAELQKVITELDELMDQEFRRTFKAVGQAFTHYFTRLFGGGTAKLMLTDPKDITNTGVEIIARPPGKRPANLTMLSGGERALTAASLIFAIISVSPTPFAVLDEIDAALDEANIERVKNVLSELSEKAQFIVITHSRATLEIANTIYGVSMGADSVSQILSLKLDGDRLSKAA